MNLPDFLTLGQYGDICLTGHRIDLLHIVDCYNEGMSVEGIAVEYPTLSLAHIYKTLAFYLENRAEVDEYVATCRAEINRQMAASPSVPSLAELRRRLESRRVETA
jgi:uncharacterized protein (DUF433 family)